MRNKDSLAFQKQELLKMMSSDSLFSSFLHLRKLTVWCLCRAGEWALGLNVQYDSLPMHDDASRLQRRGAAEAILEQQQNGSSTLMSVEWVELEQDKHEHTHNHTETQSPVWVTAPLSLHCLSLNNISLCFPSRVPPCLPSSDWMITLRSS